MTRTHNEQNILFEDIDTSLQALYTVTLNRVILNISEHAYPIGMRRSCARKLRNQASTATDGERECSANRTTVLGDWISEQETLFQNLRARRKTGPPAQSPNGRNGLGIDGDVVGGGAALRPFRRVPGLVGLAHFFRWRATSINKSRVVIKGVLQQGNALVKATKNYA